jgi:hypothetical protein
VELAVVSVRVGGWLVAPMTIPDWPRMVIGAAELYVFPRTSLYDHPLSGRLKVTELLFTLTTARPFEYWRK